MVSPPLPRSLAPDQEDQRPFPLMGWKVHQGRVESLSSRWVNLFSTMVTSWPILVTCFEAFAISLSTNSLATCSNDPW